MLIYYSIRNIHTQNLKCTTGSDADFTIVQYYSYKFFRDTFVTKSVQKENKSSMREHVPIYNNI